MASILPNVLELGTSRAARRIETALHEQGVSVLRRERPGQSDASASSATRALLLVPPIADLSPVRYCGRFRKEHPEIPVLVATTVATTALSEGALYRAGAQAVFRWPAERRPLLRTAMRLTGAGPNAAKTPRQAGDIALEERVRGYLRTAPEEFGPTLSVRAHRGDVVLSGEVDALWKKHMAEQIASGVPGAEDVFGGAIQVRGAALSDRAIAGAIRQVLRHSTQVDPSTIALRVSGGHVTLTGTTADRRELERALDLIRHVRGVVEIDNLATVSATAKKHDRKLLARVREVLGTHHPRVRIDVTVFGGIAVLAGKIRGAALRNAVVRLVEGQPGIHRVVDKLRPTA